MIKGVAYYAMIDNESLIINYESNFIIMFKL